MRIPQPGVMGSSPTGAGVRPGPAAEPPNGELIGRPVQESGEPDLTGSGLGYRVQAGDPLIVSLRGITPPQNLEYVVDADGTINMPYLGYIRVVGMTSSEIEKEIHARYVPDYYRHATVTVLIPTQRSYYVKGEVRAPGRFPYIAGVTLLRAISGAAGPNDYANVKRIRIIRGDATMGPFNLNDIQNDPSRDVVVEPGDVIDVPRGWL
jgi:polysaccharide export outer membrane protein